MGPVLFLWQITTGTIEHGACRHCKHTYIVTTKRMLLSLKIQMIMPGTLLGEYTMYESIGLHYRQCGIIAVQELCLSNASTSATE